MVRFSCQTDIVFLMKKFTRVQTVMKPGKTLVPESTYTCPNGNTLTFRGGDSAKILMALNLVESMGLSKWEAHTLRTLLEEQGE